MVSEPLPNIDELNPTVKCPQCQNAWWREEVQQQFRETSPWRHDGHDVAVAHIKAGETTLYHPRPAAHRILLVCTRCSWPKSTLAEPSRLALLKGDTP